MSTASLEFFPGDLELNSSPIKCELDSVTGHLKAGMWHKWHFVASEARQAIKSIVVPSLVFFLFMRAYIVFVYVHICVQVCMCFYVYAQAGQKTTWDISH